MREVRIIDARLLQIDHFMYLDPEIQGKTWDRRMYVVIKGFLKRKKVRR